MLHYLCFFFLKRLNFIFIKLLASKYLVDEGESDEIYNNEWASVADIPIKKINSLERTFLNKIEWNMFVSSDEFWNFTNDLTEK